MMYWGWVGYWGPGKVTIISPKAAAEMKSKDILPGPPGVVIVFFREETMSECFTDFSVTEYLSAWDCTAVS